jgi:hypothetical protein
MTTAKTKEQLQSEIDSLERRNEILTAAHSMIEIGMRSIAELNDRLRKENEIFRTMIENNQQGTH